MKRNDYEHREQAALFQWAALSIKKYPELEWMFAIPNGGQRHITVARKLKQEGVKPGVPDICLPIARGGYNALYIEMKVKPNKPTKIQLAWHTALREHSNIVEVCYGWEDAVKVIKGYLKCKTT